MLPFTFAFATFAGRDEREKCMVHAKEPATSSDKEPTYQQHSAENACRGVKESSAFPLSTLSSALSPRSPD